MYSVRVGQMRRYSIAKPRELGQAVVAARRNTWAIYWTDALVVYLLMLIDALRQAEG